ncbi:MAG: cyclic nucleotide-binding domain-containing protein [Proteobacteria bacterium]|nr:cyclic nucleotide-binding domain-containing protein [Pseudomonadota bacterium]
MARGGVVVLTSAGPIQFGAPPETIKDTMTSASGVPGIFVLTREFLDYNRGVSFAEIEFPIYYNFFLKQKRVCLVCTIEQKQRVTGILRETLFGPATLNINDELPAPPEECPWKPDLKAEAIHFARHPFKPHRQMELSDLVQFELFDNANECSIDGVVIKSLADGSFSVYDSKTGLSSSISASLSKPPPRFVVPAQSTDFEPPVFGVTIIGRGHGFDPASRTTGFILWIHGRGILVDPPFDTTQWLRDNGIPSRLVDTILLTHVHADHDGGTLQIALNDDRVRLVTTNTIYESFLRKSSLITGLNDDRFNRIIEFDPLPLQRPMRIFGGRFIFNYSLHSIPTIGFQVWVGGSSLVYSADTLYDPERIQRLCDDGVLSPGRAAALIGFPWEHDLILHEAGVPPLHTSASMLATLPAEVKERLYLVHTTSAATAKDSGLRLAPLGLEGTIRLPAEPHPQEEALRWLRALRCFTNFRDVLLPQATQFIEMASVQEFEPNERIIKKGDPGEHFYIIISGQCVIHFGEVARKIMGLYEFFGEASLILGTPRTADVRALTATKLLVIEKSDFLHIARETGLEQQFLQLHHSRGEGTWDLLDRHQVLMAMNTAQRSQFQSLMRGVDHKAGEVLVCEDDENSCTFLVDHGEVTATIDGSEVRRFGRGELVGNVEAITESSGQPWTVETSSDSRIYWLEQKGLREFLLHYPGIYLRLLHYGH